MNESEKFLFLLRIRKRDLAPFFGEDAVDAFHVELGAPVVVIDSVLFLFDVGQLGVAEPADMGHAQDDISQSLEPGVELIESHRVLSVAPGIRRVNLIRAGNPLDAPILVYQIGLPFVICVVFG